MNKTWRNVGVIALGVGILTYPGILLYKYVANRLAKTGEEEGEETKTKSFAPSYRGDHKPHRRKAEASSHLQEG